MEPGEELLTLLSEEGGGSKGDVEGLTSHRVQTTDLETVNSSDKLESSKKLIVQGEILSSQLPHGSQCLQS